MIRRPPRSTPFPSTTLSRPPTASGNRSATLNITDNAGGSPQHVSLAGTGIGPMATLNPTSLSFGNQSVGTTSGPKGIQLKNTGNSTLTISGIAISGTNATDFAQTNNCPGSLAPGAQCNINVNFSPTDFGTRTASLNISDDAPNAPQVASLTGSGTTGSNTKVTLSPNQISFGNHQIGSTSAAQTTTLKNKGHSLLVITNIAVAGPNPGDFAQTNNCGVTLAAGASCTFAVTFTPTASGNRSATLNITDNAGGSPQHVSLAGTGIGPMATLNPTSLSFGNQSVGTTSGPKGIQLKNTGNSTLTISSIAISGTNTTDFAQTNNCPGSLAPGAQCNINVNFSPTDFGTRTASLSISDNAPNAPQVASLTGSGTTGSTTKVTLSPNQMSFGNHQIGSTSAAQTTTLKNKGHSLLVITNIALAGPNPGDFAQTNNCGPTLADRKSTRLNSS